MWKRGGSGVRSRQAAVAASNRPDLSRHLQAPDPATPAAPTGPRLTDWPPIQRRHDTWWQVERVELHGDRTRYVLIAECRTEDQAFDVAYKQAHRARITRWRDKRAPHETMRPVLVVSPPPTTTDDDATGGAKQ